MIDARPGGDAGAVNTHTHAPMVLIGVSPTTSR
jgi:hypothetical protein